VVHAEHRGVTAADGEPGAYLTAVYPSTEGLHQQRLRQLVDDVLAALERAPLPEYLADQLDSEWPTLSEALKFLHRPPRDADLGSLVSGRHPCQRRIALEELVAQRLALKRAAAGAASEHAPPLVPPAGALERFRAALSFRLTGAQQRALDEIAADLARTRPMHRLLQGDVGSGKTAVAAAAAFIAAAAGKQTAVMAPTELLAEQHYASFERWLASLDVAVALVTGSQTARRRAAALEAVASGEARVVVGTHALFQESVAFADLALVIVDEQHRFGVEQRLQLKRKGAAGATAPHQLVMTATPIPRTLAMTAYADLDCSVIDELPPGRTPVRTVALPEQRRPELVERVAAHCATGRQAYWVCPLIEESEAVDSSAATVLGAEL